MYDWYITIAVILIAGCMMVRANMRMGKPRKDGRPNQVPWGFVMMFSGFVIFVAFIHIMNMGGLETGPEHSLMGRMGR